MASAASFHSRVVMILKVGLPIVAIGLLATLFLVSNEDSFQGGLVFSEADLESLGSGLRITRPTFSGTTRTGDRFRFSAEVVIPDNAPPTRAGIMDLDGSFVFASGLVVSLVAESGDLELAGQTIELAGPIGVSTSNGYSLAADMMTLDLRSGTLLAAGGITAFGPMGKIDAETMTIAPSADDAEHAVILFGSDVRLMYRSPRVE